MGRRSTLLALTVASCLGAACGGAQAQVLMPDSQPLAIPAAPAHVVVPAAPDPPAAPVVEQTAQQAPPATNPANNRPRQDPPTTRPAPPPATPPAAATPPAPAPSTPTTLEAAPNQNDLENRARGLVQSAEKAMEKIDYKALTPDGRAQYDTAKRFLKQADDALKAKNVVYAWQLADKANTIATLLK